MQWESMAHHNLKQHIKKQGERMKRIIFILCTVFSLIGCSASSSRIDATYKPEMNIVTEKADLFIAQKIIRLANEKGFEQKILNTDLGYYQYVTPNEAFAFPMEITIFVEPIKNNLNKVSISAMIANKRSLQPIAKSQVYRAVDDFVEELNNELVIK